MGKSADGGLNSVGNIANSYTKSNLILWCMYYTTGPKRGCEHRKLAQAETETLFESSPGCLVKLCAGSYSINVALVEAESDNRWQHLKSWYPNEAFMPRTEHWYCLISTSCMTVLMAIFRDKVKFGIIMCVLMHFYQWGHFADRKERVSHMRQVSSCKVIFPFSWALELLFSQGLPMQRTNQPSTWTQVEVTLIPRSFSATHWNTASCQLFTFFSLRMFFCNFTR